MRERGHMLCRLRPSDNIFYWQSVLKNLLRVYAMVCVLFLNLKYKLDNTSIKKTGNNDSIVNQNAQGK